jgi:hypothetical protein
MEKHHHEWWENFIKYGVMYLPTLSFFLWLAITVAGNLDKNKEFLGSTEQFNSGGIGGLFSSIVQLVLVIGIIIFGLKAAGEAGGIGADLGMSLAKKTGLGVAKFGYDKFGIKRGVQRAAGGASGALGAIRNNRFVGGFVNHFTPIGRLANSAAGFAHRTHDMEEWQKNNVSHLNDHALDALVTHNDIEAAGKLAEISKRKRTNDFLSSRDVANPTNDPLIEQANAASRQALIGELANMAHASGNIHHKHGTSMTDVAEIKDALDTVPALVEAVMGMDHANNRLYRTIAQQYERMSPGKIAELHHSNFADTADGNASLLAIANNPSAINAIFTNGSEALKDNVRAGLNRLSLTLAGPVQGAETILANADRALEAAIRSGATPQDIRAAKGARNTAIINARNEINLIPDLDERSRQRAIVNARASERQVVAKRTDNVINP